VSVDAILLLSVIKILFYLVSELISKINQLSIIIPKLL